MTPLSATRARLDVSLIDAYWRVANYLPVGQIYLLVNPLPREPLRAEHVKPRFDEFEQRDGARFRRWLEAGARAGGDPGRCLATGPDG